jgi:hypothetical protein
MGKEPEYLTGVDLCKGSGVGQSDRVGFPTAAKTDEKTKGLAMRLLCRAESASSAIAAAGGLDPMFREGYALMS